ncbi:MAG: FAD:protein FMN transferase [Stagnimonas sp.]|nr:FAD:protein FMN transferase [Stagnimonas sp.]
MSPAAGGAEELVARFGLMACQAEIRVAGVDADAAQAGIEAAHSELRRIEAKYSRYQSDSLVSRINAAAGSGVAVTVDEETAGLLDFAASLHQQSEGLFDISSGVLRRAWNFRAAQPPRPEQIAELLPLIGWSRVDWNRSQRRIALPQAGMEIDFGGFGKEYAADRAAAVLVAAGLHHGYVNLGGDIRLLGPRPDGRPWSFGIQHPRQAGATVAGLALGSGALATSGDYERYLEVDGRRYCHILNPRTGWPARCWQSVSVQAPLCLAAGALTTVAMLMEEAGPAFLRRQNVPFLTINERGELRREGL